MPKIFAEYFTTVNTLHRSAAKDDLEKYILYFITKIRKSTDRRTIEENLAIFQQGWTEHEQAWEESGNITALIPRYFRNAKPCFLGPDGDMLVADDALLLMHMQELAVRLLSLTWFKEYGTIHEFGSGSGWNLMIMGSTTPDKRIVGYEWTPAGVKLAYLIGKKSGLDISGRHFDMLNPDSSVECRGDAVLTFCAIEQLQENYDDFIAFLLEKKPGIVVTVEPDAGNASETSMNALLSDFYLNLRGYSRFLIKQLQHLHDRKKIEILFSRRIPWLSSFHHVCGTVWKVL